MEEEIDMLKEMGPEKYLALATEGNILNLITIKISNNFRVDDPIEFFKKSFEAHVHSVLINWFGWWNHHTQNLEDILTLLKVTYEDIEHDFQIVHKYCNRVTRISEAEYTYFKEPHRNDQEEFRRISNPVIGSHELNFNLIIKLGDGQYEYELNIWDPPNSKSQVVGLINFINYTLEQINYSKKWFLGFIYCTKEQYRFISENSLIPSLYKKEYIGLNSMNILFE